MEFLSGFAGSLIPFLLILTVLVFVHELGHYWVARRTGVRVEVFSIGFGPEIFGFDDKHGTRWKFSAIPLGGYVKMFGDADPASATSEGLAEMTPEEKAVSFHYKSVAQRTAIVAAGPAANFLFAIVLLAGMFMVVGQRYAPATIDEVMAGSAAAEAGLVAGDRVLEVDGTEVTRFADLQIVVRENPGTPLPMRVQRGDAELTLSVTPKEVVTEDNFGNVLRFGQLGVRSNNVEFVKHGPAAALWNATLETYNLTAQTLRAVGQMVTGARGTEELGGPIKIAQMSGEVAKTGWAMTFWFMAVLSVNLGLINLFPIPVLDGGHLVFYAAEAIRGKPLNERFREYASVAGLSLVIALMVFVTWNDIVNHPLVQRIGDIFG
ncbi:MAG: RIP metalloprotease RseP [Nisaea sp.]|uniref:RIP metalloprotease RseP n=1 Tax=Nisaea sp. TaxID=2024842 RepID=UPI001B157CEE|nr:RIP metalloprotease RseP [Nisaea sp.]MBO6559220.1 RIP metalloprotease RseP [Nisaea sp.]